MRHVLLGSRDERGEPDEPTLGVSSLVDVSFLLLIYFIVSTTMHRAERDLDLAMQRGEGTGPVPTVIEVRKGGEVVLNPGPREWLVSGDPSDHSLPVLRDHLGLAKALGRGGELAMVIRADDEARQQRVIDVLNCLQAAGVGRVSFEEG